MAAIAISFGSKRSVANLGRSASALAAPASAINPEQCPVGGLDPEGATEPLYYTVAGHWCAVHDRFVEVDGHRFEFPIPYSLEEDEFFKELTAILVGWGEEGLSRHEMDTAYEFTYEAERRFILIGGWS
ncbi:MAG: hypothetical protein H0V56_04430 [Chthoniobacterales bacterium]|nr:hypothetical protein [Chthoniobacterales bacterium]